jgi:hypothetical protein
MKFGKISISAFFHLILFSLVLVVFLKTTALPLQGEVDYLTEMGMVKANQMIDAPDFLLPDLEGNQGKFVMLNFWATW